MFTYVFFSATPCLFSARGPDNGIAINIDNNRVLVFDNTELNVCGGYDNTTGENRLAKITVGLIHTGRYRDQTR